MKKIKKMTTYLKILKHKHHRPQTSISKTFAIDMDAYSISANNNNSKIQSFVFLNYIIESQTSRT